MHTESSTYLIDGGGEECLGVLELLLQLTDVRVLSLQLLLHPADLLLDLALFPGKGKRNLKFGIFVQEKLRQFVVAGGREPLGLGRDQVLQEFPNDIDNLIIVTLRWNKLAQQDHSNCMSSYLQMSSTSSTMERSVSRVGCDGGGAKVGGVPAAVSALEDEEEVVISEMVEN